jgi:peptidoglycan-associated lipoprotein
MKMKKYLLPVLVAILVTGCANQHYNKGVKDYNDFAYASATENFEKALEKDSTNAQAQIKLAESYRLINDYKNAERMYAKVIQLPESTPEDKMHYAKLLMSANKHEDAANMLRLYLQSRPDDKSARALLEACTYIELFMEDTSRYALNAIPLFGNVSMFGPVKYKKGIAYAAERSDGGKTNPWTGNSYLDIFYNYQENGEWQTQSAIGGDMEGKFHEGPVTISQDGTFAIVTRSNYKKGSKLDKNQDNVNHFGLYEMNFKNGKWSDPKALHFNSTDYSVGHGSLTPDGKTLYFTSDMPGGFGGSDLYVTTFDGTSWSIPKNMGDQINTSGNEVFPSVHTEDILYFSSDGWASLGGLDIFKVERDGDNWSSPKNLNFPLNSTSDDFSYIINKDDTTGFLSSNRGGVDRIFEWAKVAPKIMVEGICLNKTTGTPLSGVAVKLINKTDGTERVVMSGDDGKFNFNLRADKEYRVEGTKDNYFTQSHDFNTLGVKEEKTIRLEFSFDEIVVGGDKKYTVENIYYDYDKWDIRPDAAQELNKLVKMLNDNKTIKIELHSHTDTRASSQYNLNLSNQRAKAAVDYLISQGIDASRVKSKGFGKSKLINRCKDGVECSEEEHQQNRRTEFIVTEK